MELPAEKMKSPAVLGLLIVLAVCAGIIKPVLATGMAVPIFDIRASYFMFHVFNVFTLSQKGYEKIFIYKAFCLSGREGTHVACQVSGQCHKVGTFG